MNNSLTIFLSSVLFVCWNCQAQEPASTFTYDDFEAQILDYQPSKTADLSDRAFDFGTMVLRETKSATKNDPANFNYADYFNILSAFLTLQESPENIQLAFQKLKDTEGSCEYFIAFKETVVETDKYLPVRAQWLKREQECRQNQPPKEETFDLQAYVEEFNLDEALVVLMDRIEQADQQYRTVEGDNDKEQQRTLDLENQKLIDSLYGVYKSYVGRSIVGKRYESTMWAVIQHSNVDMMERYLPVVHAAVQKGELELVPLKMLIDRYYGLRYGYQVFGSQSGFGFELADKATRDTIADKYGIE